MKAFELNFEHIVCHLWMLSIPFDWVQLLFKLSNIHFQLAIYCRTPGRSPNHSSNNSNRQDHPTCMFSVQEKHFILPICVGFVAYNPLKISVSCDLLLTVMFGWELRVFRWVHTPNVAASLDHFTSPLPVCLVKRYSSTQHNLFPITVIFFHYLGP